jgi:hypothetical protein
MDLIRGKKVFCTPKLSQDKDYGDRPFKFHQKCDRTPRNQFFLCGRFAWEAILSLFKVDLPLHIEAFYRYQFNDRISLTPGLIWLTAPNQDNDNPDAVIVTLR